MSFFLFLCFEKVLSVRVLENYRWVCTIDFLVICIVIWYKFLYFILNWIGLAKIKISSFVLVNLVLIRCLVDLLWNLVIGKNKNIKSLFVWKMKYMGMYKMIRCWNHVLISSLAWVGINFIMWLDFPHLAMLHHP